MPTVLELLTKKFPQARKTTLREMIADKRVMLGDVPIKSFNQVIEDEAKFSVRDRAKKAKTISPDDSSLDDSSPSADAANSSKRPLQKPLPRKVRQNRQDDDQAYGPTSQERTADRDFQHRKVENENQFSSRQSPRQAEARLPMIYEDGELFVINKPPGLMTSSGENDRRPTAIGILRDHFSRDRRVQVGLIHRLDKDASGLLVFSKTPNAFRDLKRQFADKSAGREYVAYVESSGPVKPVAGRIESRLVELMDGRVVTTTKDEKGDQAILDYRVAEQKGRFAKLTVRLNTGRKHQIRVQLAKRGWPIVGDVMYHPDFAEKPDPAIRLMLCARRLELTHPITGEPLLFETEIPPEIEMWWSNPLLATLKPIRVNSTQPIKPKPKLIGPEKSPQTKKRKWTKRN